MTARQYQVPLVQDWSVAWFGRQLSCFLRISDADCAVLPDQTPSQECEKLSKGYFWEANALHGGVRSTSLGVMKGASVPRSSARSLYSES